MKKSTLTTVILHVVLTVLFFQEDPGLNYLILQALLFVWLLLTDRDKNTSPHFWGFSALMTLIASGIFVSGGMGLSVVYMLLLPYWVLSSRYPVYHLLLLPGGGLFKYIIGIKQWMVSIMGAFRHKSINQTKFTYNGIGIVVSLLLLFALGKFYTSANPVFGQYFEMSTSWIAESNLFMLLGFQLWVQLLMRGASSRYDFFSPLVHPALNTIYLWFEERLRGINVSMILTALHFLRMGMIALLLGLLAAEAVTFTQPVKSYADAVHETFENMLGSFALTVLIMMVERFVLMYNKEMKPLQMGTYMTIGILNLVFVAITAYKDYAYMVHDGITERRLELPIWLLWASLLMLLAMLTDQAITPLKVLGDRFVLISASCLVINIAMPYQHLCLWSYTVRENKTNLANTIFNIIEDRWRPKTFSSSFSASFKYYTSDDGVTHASDTRVRLAKKTPLETGALSLEKRGVSYTAENWLEVEILRRVKVMGL